MSLKFLLLAFLLAASVALAFLIRPLEPEENIRLPAAAGRFYPSDPSELYDLIERLMESAPSKGLRGVKAILVPHAGYAYSAAVAADSFREVDPDFRRVFLLASNHRGDVDLAGVSLPPDQETHYAVPGARIRLSGILKKLRKEPGFSGLFKDEPAVHSMHMIEAELPFLHYIKMNQPFEIIPMTFEIVPMILGRMDRSAVSRLAEVLDRHADDGTLFVFSVDLSHYFPDQQARRLDTQTIQSIMSRDAEAIARSTTDGNQVLLTLLALAERRGWEPTFLKYLNSGDATGDLSRVVGYASIVFHEPLLLTEEERRELLRVARQTVEETVRAGPYLKDPDLPGKPSHDLFNSPRGVFVTLKKNGQLRGCIGSLFPEQSLYEGVRKNAANAAKRDPRFPPVTAEELDQIVYSISVLDYPRRLEAGDPSGYLKVLKSKKDGVILSYVGRQSTFLPQVWENLPDPGEFLSELCRKQGSSPECWRDPKAVLYRYGAFEFGEFDR